MHGTHGNVEGHVDAEISRKRIVLLTHYYWPEPIIFPPQITEALAEAGYEITVVTGYPNRPNGKLHPGYKQRYRFSEVINDIQVLRVPHVINHSRKALERIVNFLSFSLGALTATSEVRGADVVYVYASPATAAIPAQIWRLLFRVPYILHVQDLWPESVTDSGMMGNGRINRLAGRVMGPWLKNLYGKAAALVAISPGMRQVLIDRGNDQEKTFVVYNWADEKTISEKSSRSFSKNKLRLLYAGNLGIMQDVETIVEAAKKFEGRQDFQLTIAGGGVMEDTLRDASESLGRTELTGQLTPSEVSELYLESDFQLVTLKDIPIFRVTVPSKLQASLAAGVPVITTVKGDVAGLINRYQAGIVAEPEDSNSLALAFERALNMTADQRAEMGRNARQLYDEHMSHRAGTSALAAIVAGACSKVTETGMKVSQRGGNL